MNESPVRIERRGRAALLTIDRPARMNSLSRSTLTAFGRAGQSLGQASDLRAIVVTGAGDRAFCAGADLKERQTMSVEQVRTQLAQYRADLGWISQSAVPVVAAINGAALGGGLELALMCHLRVAVHHATFALPETGLGIIPGAGGTQRLPHLIGAARAAELILLGRRLDAAEAAAFGLVNRIAPPEVPVVEDTLAWIEPILEGAPLAQTAALRAITAAANVSLSRGLELELDYYETCLRSQDRVEALAALAEKRKPKFTGA